jgi:hypothetical protein
MLEKRCEYRNSPNKPRPALGVILSSVDPSLKGRSGDDIFFIENLSGDEVMAS